MLPVTYIKGNMTVNEISKNMIVNENDYQKMIVNENFTYFLKNDLLILKIRYFL
jgi:hypothetical protein